MLLVSLLDAGSPPETLPISTVPLAREARACKGGKDLEGGKSRAIGPGVPGVSSLLREHWAPPVLCLSFSLCHKRGYPGKRTEYLS